MQTAREKLARSEIGFNNLENKIKKANRQKQNLNLFSKVKSISATYIIFRGISNVLSLSDELTNTQARLNMINDNLQITD